MFDYKTCKLLKNAMQSNSIFIITLRQRQHAFITTKIENKPDDTELDNIIKNFATFKVSY